MAGANDPSPSTPVRGRWVSIAAWLAWIVSVVALCFLPEWFPREESNPAPVDLVFAPDAARRVETWLAPVVIDRPVAGDFRFARILVARDFVRIPLVDASGRSVGAVELYARAEASHRGAALESRSFAVVEVFRTDSDVVRRIIGDAAHRIAERDDGRAVKSVSVRAPDPLPETFRWLGFALLACGLALALRDRFRLPSARDAVVKRTHLLPIALQLAIFCYWAIYWPPVRQHVPVVVAQLMFAYALDVLLAWALRRPWPGLFAVVAPVLSANLFVWFGGTAAWVGFVVIGLALVSKALIRRDGKHIFNPSAFGTAVVGLLVVFFPDTFGYTDIAFGLSMPPSMSEVMFLVTLIPLALLGTAYVSIGAVVGLVLLQSVTGMGPGFTWPGWFLAVTIFAGDPATVPRSPSARLVFGFLVGAGIQISAVLLQRYTGTDFWAKVLPIPLVNLVVPWLDRRGPAVDARVARIVESSRVPMLRVRPIVIAVTIWACIFLSELRSAKRGGFSIDAQTAARTPLTCREPDGSLRCASNRVFCEPFRFDLEVAAWMTPEQQRCPSTARGRREARSRSQ